MLSIFRLLIKIVFAENLEFASITTNDFVIEVEETHKLPSYEEVVNNPQKYPLSNSQNQVQKSSL